MTPSALRFSLPPLPPVLSFPANSGGGTPRLQILTTNLHRRLSITRAVTNAATSAFSFLKELYLDDEEIAALLLDHPELEFASPDSMRHRVFALQSLGISDLGIHRTVVRRPDILSAPELGPFLDFVCDELKGLKPSKLERLLVTTHPEFFAGITARVTLLLDHGFPREKLGHLLNFVDIRKVFCESPLRDLEEIILFLKRYGWPDLVLRRPMLLNMDLHSQLVPRVEFLVELADGDEEAATVLISKLPALLSYTVEHFRSHVEFWRSVGLTDEQLFKIAVVYPNIFSVSRERKLEPRIELLRQCDMNAEDIFKFLVKAPLFMSLSFQENLSKKLSLLVKIGYKHRTRELAWAFGATTRTSCENMQKVIELFLSYGLSCEDILAMSKKHPQVLQYNHESLEKKMEFLIEDLERDIGEILVFPAFLGYKLDDRIKRRYEIKRNVRGKGMSLNKLLSVSTERFGHNS
ncbi:hypothetical protein Cni_G25561 [Canna indica]|uniref:Transcription termination factor MTERF8, chloroplastic n=1 Tax=Canna indica TaxID=4628 RepID=A0AAQ3KX76_9LILI|nr:hypothetical protein Cni_G25561 [Canna indica]